MGIFDKLFNKKGKNGQEEPGVTIQNQVNAADELLKKGEEVIAATEKSLDEIRREEIENTRKRYLAKAEKERKLTVLERKYSKIKQLILEKKINLSPTTLLQDIDITLEKCKEQKEKMRDSDFDFESLEEIKEIPIGPENIMYAKKSDARYMSLMSIWVGTYNGLPNKDDEKEIRPIEEGDELISARAIVQLRQNKENQKAEEIIQGIKATTDAEKALYDSTINKIAEYERMRQAELDRLLHGEIASEEKSKKF